MSKLCKDEIEATMDIIQTEYDKRFADTFKKVKEIYKRMQSEVRPINDTELGWVLVDLPMLLFDVSEQVSQLKAAYEVGKLSCKEKLHTFVEQSTAKTVALKQIEAEAKLSEYKADLVIYHTLIQRVENEIDLARELIMGAKKIWDSRRKTEQVNPIAPVPEYKAPKTPIFGSEG